MGQGAPGSRVDLPEALFLRLLSGLTHTSLAKAAGLCWSLVPRFGCVLKPLGSLL